MAKIIDTIAVKQKTSSTSHNYNVDQKDHKYDSLHIVCGEAVKAVLGSLPKRIRLRIYTKNPKRKNQVHVKIIRNKYGTIEDYTWLKRRTGVYGTIEWELPKGIDEFWAIIEKV